MTLFADVSIALPVLVLVLVAAYYVRMRAKSLTLDVTSTQGIGWLDYVCIDRQYFVVLAIGERTLTVYPIKRWFK